MNARQAESQAVVRARHPAIAHVITPYKRDQHEPFVLASWRSGGHNARATMATLLRAPAVRCFVAHHPKDADALFGWCAVDWSEPTRDAEDVPYPALLWVYVRDLYGTGRRGGIGTALMLAAGLDPSQPTPCRFWSPYATRLAARGYRLYYAPDERKTAP